MYFIDSMADWTQEISDESKINVQKLDTSLKAAVINKTRALEAEDVVCLSSVFPKAVQLQVDSHLQREMACRKSLKLYVCIEGRALVSLNGQNEEVRAGQALLVPNSERPLHFYAPKARLLEIKIPGGTT
ncbi:hypothetical protein BST85_00210 [Aureitalea marina]|uniref:Uncharacterized protein n=2 Tax=Aureitalea marina TaxID=930804 RepID=A0A2S7KLN1_9FLAO|nr:hypothetical protein BST85_00210 [Aureitalea marina]